MSKIRTVLSALLALSALTVIAPSHAETPTQEGQPIVIAQVTDRLQTLVNVVSTPVVDTKELNCLARNIFFEAGNEPEEGKVAVGLVTMNRVQDGRFSRTICGVVDQKVTRDVSKEVVVIKKRLMGTDREIHTVWSKISICQFSWRCMFVRNPKSTDERWVESQQVARALLTTNDYDALRDKYSEALYFHATRVRPSWSKQKEHVGRIGGHHFYAERSTAKY